MQENNIIHSDLTPDNVLITENLSLKIVSPINNNSNLD